MRLGLGSPPERRHPTQAEFMQLRFTHIYLGSDLTGLYIVFGCRSLAALREDSSRWDQNAVDTPTRSWESCLTAYIAQIPSIW